MDHAFGMCFRIERMWHNRVGQNGLRLINRYFRHVLRNGFRFIFRHRFWRFRYFLRHFRLILRYEFRHFRLIFRHGYYQHCSRSLSSAWNGKPSGIHGYFRHIGRSQKSKCYRYGQHQVKIKKYDCLNPDAWSANIASIWFQVST